MNGSRCVKKWRRKSKHMGPFMYLNEWKHFHWEFLLALTSIYFIVFLFCLHFCLLGNLEIIRCIVKSMIAPSMYLLLKYSWKKKTWKSFLGTRIRAPKLVYWSPKWPEYVTCKTSSEKNWPYLLTRIIWIMKEILNSLQIII